jgi:phosphatidylglycerophosphate synthase
MPMMQARWWIPYSLVWFRLLLAPVFVAGYFLDASPWLCVALLVAGIISDIFDGVLARRWGTSTLLLRRCDSNVDMVFYGVAGVIAVLLHAAWLAPWWFGLAAMFGFMIAQSVVNGVRFRQQPAYHMWSGKLWSIVLVVALIGLFLGRPMAWSIDALLALAIWNSIEGIIASLILPRPMADIPTVFHAIRIARRSMAAEE